MRIGLLYDYLSEIGGVERVMAAHARWLMAGGHEVELCYSHIDAATAQYDFLKGLTLRELSRIPRAPESVKLAAALCGGHTLSPQEYDLVICYSFPSLFLSRFVAVPKLFYYLPLEFAYFSLRKRWAWANDAKRKMAFFGSLLLSPLIRRRDRSLIQNCIVLANSAWTQREIRARYGVEAHISHPPLHPAFSPPAVPIEHPQGALPLILTAGRIVPDKRTDWIIEAFAHMRTRARLFVAGDISKDFRESLHALAVQRGVHDRLLMVGRVAQEELVQLYRTADVFAFASPHEAFGLAPIEAMACGCPVVAWEDGAGPSEYVQSGVNGRLCPPYDLGAFAAALDEMISISMRQCHSSRIVNSVNRFSEASVSSDFLAMVSAAMAKRRGPA